MLKLIMGGIASAVVMPKSFSDLEFLECRSGTKNPQAVPIVAPARTSVKKWFPLAIRNHPVNAAIPKEKPATAAFHFEFGKL